MNNFSFQTPTRIVFGKNSIASLSNLVPKSAKIMMTYGSGSIKKNGVYDQVKTALAGFNVIEFSSIEPNPKYETLMQAVEIVKDENIDFLLAVGGGSVLDGTKFIAAASCFSNGDPWKILSEQAPVDNAIALGCVMTLPATGSEMNPNAVISRESTRDKLEFVSEKVIPKFSILDPAVTTSLPLRQTINGIVDTFVHVVEQVTTKEVNTPVQDLSAMAILRTLVSEAPKILQDPENYDVRANLFWCATLGLNNWISQGVVQDWSTHIIGHEITAEYGMDHAKSLAIVLPGLWTYKLDSKKNKLAILAREVWNSSEPTELDAAKAAIRLTEEFFNSIGMKTKFADYNLESSDVAEKISERLANQGVSCGEDGDINPSAVKQILITR